MNIKQKRELVEANNKLRLSRRINRAFASGKSLPDTLYKIVEIIGKTYHWDSVIVWMTETDARLRYYTSWYEDKEKNKTYIQNMSRKTFSPGNGNIGKASYRQTAVLTDNTIYRKSLAYPLVLENETIAVIEFLGAKHLSTIRNCEETMHSLAAPISQYINRKQTASKLLQSEERSQAITDLAPAIIYTLDDVGKINSLNPAVETVTGIKAEHLLGQPLEALFCDDVREDSAKKMDELREKSENGYVTFETEIVTKNGELLMGEIKEKAKKSKGKVVERFGIIRDVTERYHLEKQKDLWMGIATHELKTPLASIKAFTQILEHKAAERKDKELKEVLGKINSLTDDMSQLIADLLDVTKMRSGTLDMSLERVNMYELVNEVVQRTEPTSSHKFIVNSPKKLFATVDKKRIVNVIVNLLSNAIKYSPKDTNIIVELIDENGDFMMKVQDFGSGIHPQDINHIFDLFYRGNKSPENKSFGVGLGLYISKAIVNAHGGDIWVESILNKGTTFFVSIPKD
jgi:PAS domain S-box-containing protein